MLLPLERGNLLKLYFFPADSRCCYSVGSFALGASPRIARCCLFLFAASPDDVAKAADDEECCNHGLWVFKIVKAFIKINPNLNLIVSIRFHIRIIIGKF